MANSLGGALFWLLFDGGPDIWAGQYLFTSRGLEVPPPLHPLTRNRPPMRQRPVRPLNRRRQGRRLFHIAPLGPLRLRPQRSECPSGVWRDKMSHRASQRDAPSPPPKNERARCQPRRIYSARPKTGRRPQVAAGTTCARARRLISARLEFPPPPPTAARRYFPLNGRYVDALIFSARRLSRCPRLTAPPLMFRLLTAAGGLAISPRSALVPIPLWATPRRLRAAPRLLSPQVRVR